MSLQSMMELYANVIYGIWLALLMGCATGFLSVVGRTSWVCANIMLSRYLKFSGPIKVAQSDEEWRMSCKSSSWQGVKNSVGSTVMLIRVGNVDGRRQMGHLCRGRLVEFVDKAEPAPWPDMIQFVEGVVIALVVRHEQVPMFIACNADWESVSCRKRDKLILVRTQRY